MPKVEEKLTCISPRQFNEIVKNGLSYARISFRDETEPIYIAFKEKPTNTEVSVFLKDSLGIIKDGFTITWSEYILDGV